MAYSLTPEQMAQAEKEHEARKAEYLDKPMKEITARRYYELNGCVPPFNWHTEGRVERFHVGEAMYDTLYEQCIKYTPVDPLGGTGTPRYFCKITDATKRDTWVTLPQIEAFIEKNDDANKSSEVIMLEAALNAEASSLKDLDDIIEAVHYALYKNGRLKEQ